jgi:transposase
MKALTISDKEEMILALQDEIRRSPDARYDHRLHGVLLVAEGMSCRQAAEALGDSHGTVANWVSRFEKDGFGGLNEQEGRGRRSRLGRAEMKQVEVALRKSPADYGLPAQLWDGLLLSSFLRAFSRRSSASRYVPDNANGYFGDSDFVFANLAQKSLKPTRKCKPQ